MCPFCLFIFLPFNLYFFGDEDTEIAQQLSTLLRHQYPYLLFTAFISVTLIKYISCFHYKKYLHIVNNEKLGLQTKKCKPLHKETPESPAFFYEISTKAYSAASSRSSFGISMRGKSGSPPATVAFLGKRPKV